MDIFTGAYNMGQIAEAKTDAMQAKAKADQTSERLRDLEYTVNRMALTCQALWELLRARGLTEEELLAKMNEVDLRDGTQDGRMTPVIVKCPQCGRPSNSKHARCMYCGVNLDKPHVFQ